MSWAHDLGGQEQFPQHCFLQQKESIVHFSSFQFFKAQALSESQSQQEHFHIEILGHAAREYVQLKAKERWQHVLLSMYVLPMGLDVSSYP